ncbi:hypothetical protein HZB90_04455 [archaeon]|nr:hypothetical protein [archaeon]
MSGVTYYFGKGTILAAALSALGFGVLFTHFIEKAEFQKNSSQQEAAFNKSVDESYAAPQETDLNMDGVPDIVLNLGDGRKIPLYGVRSPDGTVRNYLTGAKMQNLFSDRPVDYEGIAAKLNQQ